MFLITSRFLERIKDLCRTPLLLLVILTNQEKTQMTSACGLIVISPCSSVPLMIKTPLHPQISFKIIKTPIWIWGPSSLPELLSILIQTRWINRINLAVLPKKMRNVWRAKVMRGFNSLALGIKELLSWQVGKQQSSHSVMKVRMLKCPMMRWLIPKKTTRKKQKVTIHL